MTTNLVRFGVSGAVLLAAISAAGTTGCRSGGEANDPTAPSQATTYTLTGTVSDATTGATIQGATVEFTGSQHRSTTTSSSGRYSFSAIPFENRINIVTAYKFPEYGLSEVDVEDYPQRSEILLNFRLPRAK